MGPVCDARLPAVRHLLGASAGEVLAAALAPHGVHVQDALACQVLYHPGRRVAVRYRASLRWRDGRCSDEDLVAAAGVDDAAPGAAVVAADGMAVAVWRYPYDPCLPGLAAATSAARVGAVLEELGAAWGTVTLRVRSYRPRDRAVVEADAAGLRVFLKVLPPPQAQALHRLHRGLQETFPVPRSLGWAAPLGLVVLEALPGRTLRGALLHGNGPLPTGPELRALLDALPPVGRRRDDVAVRAAGYAAMVAAVLPDEARRVQRIVRAVRQAGAAPVRAVHGDYHDGQILVTDAGVSGVVDVDDAGVGRRGDDLATLLAHLSVLALVRPAAAARLDAYRASLLDDFARVVPVADLRRSVAGMVLGLATGPFREQAPDWPDQTRRVLQVAEEWLARSDRRAA